MSNNNNRFSNMIRKCSIHEATIKTPSNSTHATPALEREAHVMEDESITHAQLDTDTEYLDAKFRLSKDIIEKLERLQTQKSDEKKMWSDPQELSQGLRRLAGNLVRLEYELDMVYETKEINKESTIGVELAIDFINSGLSDIVGLINTIVRGLKE